jgi:hypothetical protein
MSRLGKSRRSLTTCGVCAAVNLAPGGCSDEGDSGSEQVAVVQVTGTSTQTGDITWLHEFSDPRVSGEATNDPHCVFSEDGERTTGTCTVTSTISNVGGAWDGGCTRTTTWTVSDPEHLRDMDCTLLGAGGYAGLRFVCTLMGGDVDPWQMTGQIDPVTASPTAPKPHTSSSPSRASLDGRAQAALEREESP